MVFLGKILSLGVTPLRVECPSGLQSLHNKCQFSNPTDRGKCVQLFMKITDAISSRVVSVRLLRRQPDQWGPQWYFFLGLERVPWWGSKEAPKNLHPTLPET